MILRMMISYCLLPHEMLVGYVSSCPDKRVDIYYFQKGKSDRLRSLAEVERYCNRNEIRFVPYNFDFKGSNLYSGPVPNTSTDSNSDIDSDSPESNQLHPST